MLKLKEKRIQILRPSNPGASPAPASKKSFSFWGLFSSSQSDSPGSSVLLKGPTLKGRHSVVSKADPEAVRSWVALEERIVHDYKGRKFAPVKPAFPSEKKLFKEKAAQEKLARERVLRERAAQAKADRERAIEERKLREKAAREKMIRERLLREEEARQKRIRERVLREESAQAKAREAKGTGSAAPANAALEVKTEQPAVQEVESQEKAPIFETLSIQTVTSVPSFPEKVETGHAEKRTKVFRLGTVILSLGWLAAGVFAFLYSSETSLRQHLSVQLAESYGERQQLENTVAGYVKRDGEQQTEIQRLNGRMQNMTGKLSAAQQKAAAFDAMEKSYREELLRTTTHYEGQLASMRKLVEVREDLVKALQAQVQTIDRLLSEGGLATAFTAAMKAMEAGKKKAAEASPVISAPKMSPQGEVIMVNRQYQFIIVNLGADHGAQTGGLVDIFRDGKSAAKGRLERIYPSMSAVTVFDEGAIEEIQEGDRVSLS